MHKCEICGAEFLNSDEFMAHTQKHMIEAAGKYTEFIKQYQEGTRNFDQFVDAVAHKVARILQAELPPPVATSAPEPPRYSFEVTQMTHLCLTTGKSVDEVLAVLKEVQSKIGR